MTTIHEVLQHASTLATQDAGFDAILGLRLGALELHAALEPHIGMQPVDAPELPTTVTGCLTLVHDQAVRIADGGAGAGRDTFLPSLEQLFVALPAGAATP